MRKTILLATLLCIPRLSPAQEPSAATDPDAPRPFEAALAASAADGRLVVLEFMWPGTADTVRMANEVYTDDAVRQALRRFVRVRVDPKIESNAPLVERYTGAPGLRIPYPSRIYLDGEGNEVDRVRGATDAAGLVRELETIHGTGGRLRALTRAVETAPHDIAARQERIAWGVEACRWDVVRADVRGILAASGDGEGLRPYVLERLLHNGIQASVVLEDPADALALAARYLGTFPEGRLRPEVLQLAGMQQDRTGDLDAAGRTFAEILAHHPGTEAAYRARIFFRGHEDLVERLGIDAEATGIRLRAIDALYAWVPPAEAFPQAAARQRWVFIYNDWPR